MINNGSYQAAYPLHDVSNIKKLKEIFGGGEGLRLSRLFHSFWAESVSRWGQKIGNPQEKPPNDLQAELGLSHVT